MRYGTVVFDCDSTLSSIEGIEELASEHRAEVVALTEAAMRGVVPLEEVYGRRVELVRPSRERLEALGRRYVETLVPDAKDVVAALLGEGVEVRVVSGGLRPAVLVLTRALGLPDDHVAAVDVHFDASGAYAGWDAGSPLAYAGGKRVVLERWAPSLPRPILMVGDGATDLEARPVVDAFVAFAGIVERAPVVQAADIVLRDRSLAPVVPLALDGEPPKSGAARAVFDRGARILG
ncbi:MAG TPA: HAD-IB family phosphatase [Longimicrobiales bacterium]